MDDQFNNWVDMWDKASGQMGKEAPIKKPTSNFSFFGMSSVDDNTIDDINNSDVDGWNDVNDRTTQLYAPVGDLLTEAEEKKKKKSKKKKNKVSSKEKNKSEEPEYDEEDGFDSILAKNVGDKNQFVGPNPVHFSSVGKDQKLRVTPNWTSGDALIALAKLKSMMYSLECEMLTSEALGGNNVVELEKRLSSMGRQFDKLSQKLIPDVKKDVS